MSAYIAASETCHGMPPSMWHLRWTRCPRFPRKDISNNKKPVGLHLRRKLASGHACPPLHRFEATPSSPTASTTF